MNRFIKNNFHFLLLLILTIGMLLLRSKLLFFNLPICANIDERQGLRLLYQFDNFNMNPQFFRYPALYYYITYAFSNILGNINNFIFFGRILNLIIGGGIAIATYKLAVTVYDSKNTGVIAGFFTLSSPIIVDNCSYIITDPLLSLLSLFSILYIYKFFNSDHNLISLFLMILFVGLALATKYTALLLIIVYLIFELKNKIPSILGNSKLTKFLNYDFNPKYFTIISFLIGVIIIFTVWILPIELFSALISQGGNINAKLTNSDLEFVKSILTKFIYLGTCLIFIGVVSILTKQLFKPFYKVRPYFVILLITLIFILFNPYIIISLKHFIYDFGAELKANQFAGQTNQFINYFKIYFNRESIIIFIFLFIGFYYSIREKKYISIFVIYLLISYFIIGSATRGYERYLTPILPILFIVSSFGIVSIISKITNHSKLIIILFIGLISLIFYDNYLWLKPIVGKQYHHDDIYASYHFIIKQNVDNVYYSGYVPDIELKINGKNTIEIAERNLTDKDIKTILNINDILIVDGDRQELINRNNINSIKIIKSYIADYGQYIYTLSEKQ